MNARSRKHVWKQALASGIVMGVPVLLLGAFVVSAHVTLAPRPAAATRQVRTAAPAPLDEVSPAVAARTGRAADAVLACEDADATSAGSTAKSKSKDKSHSYGYSYDSGERDFIWALVEPKGGGSVNMVGSTDFRASRVIKRAARESDERFLYVRMDGRDRLIRDPEFVVRADELVEPMQELGRKMGELGGRQGRLGGEQGRLGGQQGRLGAKMAAIASRYAVLNARIASRERRGLGTAELEQERERLEAEQEAVSRQMERLGEEQSALGDRQSALGEEQSEFGKEMQRLSREVESGIRQLTREAIEAGKAKVVGGIDA